jgi:hypothetical protein
MPAGVNGVKIPFLLSIEPKRILLPYLSLVLGRTSNVVQRILADLTSLGCEEPRPCGNSSTALLAEFEESVAAAVEDFVDVLRSRQVKAQVKHVVSEMEKFLTPAAPAATPSGVAAPTGWVVI